MPVVIPATWTTDRAELNVAIIAIVDAFIAAVPNIVRKSWNALPETLTGEGPFVYIGPITEITRHDQGTRITEFAGQLGYVDVLSNPQETADRVAVFADYMRDLFTANYGILGQGVLEQTSFLDEAELSQGALRFAAPALSWKFTVQRGRI